MANEFHEYPKAMHGPEDGYAVVNSKEEEESLGAGWVDGHAFWAAKVEAADAIAPRKTRKKVEKEEKAGAE